METQPRKIFLVASAERMSDPSGGGCREGLCSLGLQSSSEPQPCLPAPSHLPHPQPAPVPKTRGNSAGFCPPCTPRGEALQALLWCRITTSSTQLKTGNTPDSSADAEKQEGTFPRPCAGRTSLTSDWFQLLTSCPTKTQLVTANPFHPNWN